MRRHLAASVACGVVLAFSTIGSAVVLGHMVAGIITEPSTRTLTHWRTSLLTLTTLWAVRVAAHWVQGRLSQHAATAAITDISGEVLRAVTALPSNVMATRRDAAAVLVTNGLDGLRPYFVSYLPALFLAAILTPATVVVIAVNDFQSAVIVLVALPLIPVFMVLIGLATAERSNSALAAMTTLQTRLRDLIAGIPTLRALGRTDGPADKIADLTAAHHRSTMATLRIAFLSALVLELIATLGVALVAVSIGLRLVFGEITLTAGLTVLLLAPEVFWPLRRVGAEFHSAQGGLTALDRALALTESPEQVPREHLTLDSTALRIRVEGLSILGRDGMAPRGLTACARAGEVTVLTGSNGAGKSTTLEAIAGLVTPNHGHVSINGIDVAELDLDHWWRQICWLPQRPVLIPGSVLENLTLFGPIDDIGSACKAAGFDDVLDLLPNGMNTQLGRGGVGLSLGQRQRLGLARVFGSRASVLLLDEPTAHLDEAGEAAALRAIRDRAAAGVTVVMVGHRSAVLSVADQIVMVESDRHVLA